MKSIFKGIILMALFAWVIQSPNTCQAQSIHLPDTLMLKTKQEKGRGLMHFMASIHELRFKSADSLAYEVALPPNIQDIMVAEEIVDLDLDYCLRMLKERRSTPEQRQKNIEYRRIDTLNLSAMKDNSVCFLTGIRGKDTIFIVDENNNKDFRDDPMRTINPIDLSGTKGLIKCNYKIFNGKEYVTAINWITIGRWRFPGLWYASSQHSTTTVNLDKSNYELELYIDNTSFNFKKPQIAVSGGNGSRRDTVMPGEYVRLNEYIKFKKGVYRFTELTNDGSIITLIKENHYDDITGTQIGVIAPSFVCQTIDGNTISSDEYKGKSYLLVNVSGCGLPPLSYEFYRDLANLYGSQIDMIVIDKSAGALKEIQSWNLSDKFVNADIPANDEFEKIYRPDYCSWTCFLVGADGKITDKFPIFDFGKFMSRYF
jgi:hypothetical protein